ncbi:hypothetical protein HPB51_000902 [Rhipicephalus microplus]|uniref:Uncharacterized protein n=1 Tax=Rhipicephalus microplus TaxID=6941 RepID=A0A9J6DKG0_RHIMP|nr:hypothetical protein HPB51_000902 [Rhipicephalus microplus]
MGEVQTPCEDLVVGGARAPDGEQTTTGNEPSTGSSPETVAPSTDLPKNLDVEEQRCEEQEGGPGKLVRSNSFGGKKRKNRRGKTKKRKWKPYYKLSWEERRELEERESRRANRIRQPWTAQDEFYSSPEDEEDFLQKQFSEAYEDVHAERLNSMSKAELVQEYLLLEERVEELEHKLKEARAARADAQTQTGCVDARPPATDSVEQAQQKMAVFRDEIRKLADENALVRKHNRALREVLDTSPAELSAS